MHGFGNTNEFIWKIQKLRRISEKKSIKNLEVGINVIENLMFYMTWEPFQRLQQFFWNFQLSLWMHSKSTTICGCGYTVYIYRVIACEAFANLQSFDNLLKSSIIKGDGVILRKLRSLYGLMKFGTLVKALCAKW